MSDRFVIDLGWAALLDGLDLRAADVLRRAELPEDLFVRPRPTVDTAGFLRLWDALTWAMGVPDPGLTLGRAVTAEAFSPALFAAFCSPDLTVALERLSRFKPLFGPLWLEVAEVSGGLEVMYGARDGIELPTEFIAAELVFIVNLARMATRTEIRPIAVEMVDLPESESYEAYFDHPVRPGPFNRLVFSPRDARRPFMSANPALFAAFEPDLRARLDQVAVTATLADRVRAALMEALPAGQPEVKVIAKRLGLSARSLQRKLAAEDTSFQAELTALRARLAVDYLKRTAHSSAEISYLLGYEDPNSFIRAFHGWTGTTPEAMRSRRH